MKVNFLNPVGAKTGKLLPSDNVLDVIEVPGIGKVEITILDISNPMVLVKAKDVGLSGTELPDEVNSNARACELLEAIHGTAACTMGFAKDLQDATDNSPAVPKVGVLDPNKKEARKGTIAYSIMEKHNTSGDMQNLKLRFDALTSHDITFVGIIQTAHASGMEKFPLPYVLTNCHKFSLCGRWHD